MSRAGKIRKPDLVVRQHELAWSAPLESHAGVTCRSMRSGLYVVGGDLSDGLPPLFVDFETPVLCVGVEGGDTTKAQEPQVRVELLPSPVRAYELSQECVVMCINTLDAIGDFAEQYVTSWTQLPLETIGAVTLRHPACPLAKVIIDEMFTKPHHSMLERLAMEKGWLQLLALELEYFVENWNHASIKNKGLYLSKADMDLLELGRSILLRDIVSPPDMKTLSRTIGMNHFKFKKGFKQVYGVPPMAYLRSHRMEVAKRLLTDRSLSVTQVALEVGYSNPSSFSARFTEHFGHNPKNRS